MNVLSLGLCDASLCETKKTAKTESWFEKQFAEKEVASFQQKDAKLVTGTALSKD